MCCKFLYFYVLVFMFSFLYFCVLFFAYSISNLSPTGYVYLNVKKPDAPMMSASNFFFFLRGALGLFFAFFFSASPAP